MPGPLPDACGFERVKERGKQCRAVGDRGIDHLALARSPRFQDPADDAERQHQTAAAHVAEEHRRRPGLSARSRTQRKGTRECEVVEVVARRLAQRSTLAPPGHATINEARIAHETNVRTEPIALHDTRAKSLDQRVRAIDQAQRSGRSGWRLEVERNRALAAIEQCIATQVEKKETSRVFGLAALRSITRTSAPKSASIIDAKGSGPDAGEFDNPNTLQRSHCYLRISQPTN